MELAGWCSITGSKNVGSLLGGNDVNWEIVYNIRIGIAIVDCNFGGYKESIDQIQYVGSAEKILPEREGGWRCISLQSFENAVFEKAHSLPPVHRLTPYRPIT